MLKEGIEHPTMIKEGIENLDGLLRNIFLASLPLDCVRLLVEDYGSLGKMTNCIGRPANRYIREKVLTSFEPFSDHNMLTSVESPVNLTFLTCFPRWRTQLRKTWTF